MTYRPGHRKTVRHYHDPGHVHELTSSCYHRWPLLTNDVWRGMLAQIIDRAMAGHRYRLAAFVFMPEHVHLMIYPLAEADTIDAVLKGRFYLLDPPQQYSSLPTVHSLPAEFLDGGD